MRDPRPILFHDVASKFGWCEGVPGELPTFGSARFAPEGAASPAYFGGAFKWAATKFQETVYRAVFIEAPLDPRHLGQRTTRDTGLRLIGLPAAIAAAAHLCRIYDFRELRADDIRIDLLGRRLKRAEAKPAVIGALQALGYAVADPDAADALAGWRHACRLLSPSIEHAVPMSLQIAGRLDRGH